MHCQSTHSIHSGRAGASRLPWLSGTASWSYFAATHYILGIQPDYDGLRINPCLPSEWPDVEVQRNFRGGVYRIHIRRGASGCGVARLVVDGREIDGALVPVGPGEHVVDVETK